MTEQANVVNDGMANVAAGLGAVNPKTAGNIYLIHSDPAYLEQAYRGSTWFGKIVDIPATDSVRAWRQWQGSAKQIELMEKEEKRLGVKVKVRDALIMKRLFGGAVLIPSGLPGQPDKELDPTTVRKGAIKALTLLNRYQVQTEGRIDDIMSPWFGHPRYYCFTTEGGTQIKLHPSRVVRFSGPRFAHNNTADDGWGDSIWLRLADAISNSETATAALTALLTEAKIDVVRMPNLVANMATESDEQALMRRFTIATQLKSVANTLVLDKDDEYSQKSFSFASIPDSVMLLLQVLCGAAEIPMTKLLGTMAKGLSNGGDADLKTYYDGVSSDQELDIDPAMAHFNIMLVASATGSTDGKVWHEWRPLYQMSEKEEAEVEAAYAGAAEKLVNTGLIAPDVLAAAVTDRMINSGSWPALEAALAASKQQAEEVLRGERGFEPSEAEKAAAAALSGAANDPEADPDDGEEAEERRRAANDAAPRTLYVRRDLVNGEALLAWARSVGFTGLSDESKLHVTIAYSKQPVDWMKTGEDWNGRDDGTMRVAPGGVRLVEVLGDEGKAVCLLFTSSALTWRHEQIKNAGATWSWDDYQPHITFSWEGPGDIDLRNVEPYRGELIFGPEVFEEINEDWREER